MRVLPIVLPLFLLGALSLPSTAMAQQAADGQASGSDAQAIRAQQLQIREEAEAGAGRYERLPTTKRADLYARQDRVQAALAGVSRTSELDQRTRVSVFNDLEAISAIINQAEDDRMICARERLVGSNRPKTVCRSVAQRRMDQVNAAGNTNERNIICTVINPGDCVR